MYPSISLDRHENAASCSLANPATSAIPLCTLPHSTPSSSASSRRNTVSWTCPPRAHGDIPAVPRRPHPVGAERPVGHQHVGVDPRVPGPACAMLKRRPHQPPPALKLALRARPHQARLPLQVGQARRHRRPLLAHHRPPRPRLAQRDRIDADVGTEKHQVKPRHLGHASPWPRQQARDRGTIDYKTLGLDLVLRRGPAGSGEVTRR
jgi:hypothetical protein